MFAVLSVAVFVAAAVLPGESEYLRGRAAERAERFAEARGAYIECADQNGPLAPYARIRAAAVLSDEGDPAGALAELEALLAEHADGPWVPMAQNEAALILTTLDRNTEAAALYAHVLDVDYNLWWLDRYRWSAAENAVRLGQEGGSGFRYFRSVVESTPYPELRLEASEFLAASPLREDRVAAALGLLRSSKTAAAAQLVATFAPTVVGDPDLLGSWQDVSARMLIAMGNKELGLDLLLEMAEDDPESPRAPSAFAYAVGRYADEDDIESAERLVERLTVDYPESEALGDAHWTLARRYEREEKPDLALFHLNALTEEHPTHPRINDALLKSGALYWETKRPVEALDRYDRLVALRPDPGLLAEGAYRGGRVLELGGSADESDSRYRVAVRYGTAHYYGHRAQGHLVELSRSGPELDARFLRTVGKHPVVSPIPREDVSAPVNTEPLRENDARFQRLYFFGRYGFEEAEWEALGIIRGSAGEGALPQDVMTALGEAGAAYSTMQVAYAQGLGDNDDGTQTIERLRIRFPRVHWEAVKALAAETGVDPYLILSVARRESTYRPSLTSPAGAQGVMQLMPRTATWLAKVEDEIDPETAEDLHNPMNSIRLGAYYLKRMLDHYDGDVVYALAAYNAGPKNCDKWRRKHRKLDSADFVENIPFSETRAYVKRVLGYYAAYHSIYPPE